MNKRQSDANQVRASSIDRTLKYAQLDRCRLFDMLPTGLGISPGREVELCDA
jgi:hypothetical protein